jgi:hypothetical protein
VELHSSYSSSFLLGLSNWRCGTCSTHGEMRNAYITVIRKPARKKLLGRLDHRWEAGLKEMQCKAVDCIRVFTRVGVCKVGEFCNLMSHCQLHMKDFSVLSFLVANLLHTWKSQSIGYRGIFPRGESDRCMKMHTHLHLVPSSRIHGSVHPLPHTSSLQRTELVKRRDNFTLALLRTSVDSSVLVLCF